MTSGPNGDLAEAVRRRNVDSYGLAPQRAADLLAFMRKRDLTEWPPPPPTVEQRRAQWEAHVARFGLGPARWDTPWGPITPWEISEFHPDPARRMVFYLGVGHPHHLNGSPVPLFLSATTLARYRRRGEQFPVRIGGAGWAGDSGAFTALTGSNPAHPWHLDPDDFGGLWVRLIEDVGPPEFVAIQDWPCEPAARARTGLTVYEHQQQTLANYLYLAEEFPMVPWIPVLQGWHAWEYEQHAAMYEQAGIALADCHRIGLGSVCRRASDTDIAELVTALAGQGLRLHGFGVSLGGLARIGHLLASADSQAWSATARRERIRLPGCQHWTRPDPAGVRRLGDCRNCFRYALTYREEAMDAVRQAARRAAHTPAPLFDLTLTSNPPAAKPATGHRTRPGRGLTADPDQPTLFDHPPAPQPARTRPVVPAPRPKPQQGTVSLYPRPIGNPVTD